MSRWILAALAPLLLSVTGCTTLKSPGESPFTAAESLYDSRIFNTRTREPVSVSQLAAELEAADVVIVGEYHGHQASHLLQSQLQVGLHQRRPAQILSMEQFNIDHQTALDHYLAGESGEAEMREDAHAWPNYNGSYRPLIEYAKRYQLPVIAANAPAHTVRCVGRRGPAYLQTLPPAQRQALPLMPFYGTPAYQTRFFGQMGEHGDGTDQRLQNSYLAQLLRDNTMAERIAQALEANPGAQVLHTTGTFHSEDYLGTVAALVARKPEIRIRVVSPVQVKPGQPMPLSADNLGKGDYLYFILPLPNDYLDAERRRKSLQQQFSEATTRSCE